VAVDSNGVRRQHGCRRTSTTFRNGTSYTKRLGVVFNQKVYSGTFDARNNYWGNSSGPSGDGPGTGDGVYGNASKATSWSFAKGGSELFRVEHDEQYDHHPQLADRAEQPQRDCEQPDTRNLTWTNGTSATGVKIERFA